MAVISCAILLTMMAMLRNKFCQTKNKIYDTSFVTFENSLLDSFTGLHMGTCAERIITRQGITRDDQDAYSEQSYQRARTAWENGIYKNEVTPITVNDVEITQDEEFENCPREFSSLRVLFDDPKTGSVTFGNTSKLGDGACALLLMSEDAVTGENINPIARIVGHVDAAMESIDFTTAVVIAVQKLLSKYNGNNFCTISIW